MIADSYKEIRMKELIKILNNACKLYYTGDDDPPMKDATYDRYLSELALLEEQTGIRLFGSRWPSVHRFVRRQLFFRVCQRSKNLLDDICFGVGCSFRYALRPPSISYLMCGDLFNVWRCATFCLLLLCPHASFRGQHKALLWKAEGCPLMDALARNSLSAL